MYLTTSVMHTVKTFRFEANSWTGLTGQQVKYSYAEGGGEALTEAGTEPS